MTPLAAGRLRETAPAKVNLYLHVVGRRPDGYHLLDSLAVFPAIGDVLHAEPADHLSLELSGPFAGSLAAEPDNLVLRAARALAARHGIPAGARLTLEKHLPVASGIGGGSADAAAALRLLSRLWDVGLPPGIAATLGADVPVCLPSSPARMSGIGDELGPSPTLPGCGIVLVNPGKGVSTPAVFRARRGDFSQFAVLPERWSGLDPMAADLARLTNDLEAPATTLCQVIGEVLAALRALPGCALARMSGSGATCFALFSDEAAAARAAARLDRPDWWSWGGALASSPADTLARLPVAT